MMKPLAVCLVSGGLDSCVAAAVAAQDYELAFLHVNYGQRTEARELRAFHEIADFYKVKHRLVTEVPALKQIGGSALTDPNIAVPEDEPSPDRIPITYVPFRNAHFLAIAVSWGEVLGAKRIFIGASQVDFSGYPDCRASFFTAYNQVIKEGTRPETEILIETPLINLTKAEIVKLGQKLGAPLHLTWSCYQREDVACGRCESCLLRLKGFREAGLKDPIPYENG
ncbi:MAG TPA: 7-cyano-7-deazaguanine synthase QueC [Thermodesulfatator atlanticus]|uniref:7-cyano-7-deazaguanine synthase n=1 Tax=Thermodesulfatator atlanticus TaxID=501497 RepID=A0A7V5U3C7_9BACT|nr:7-cyano-7-deazaguanine synthase QueC [Thermodesulfatator atlanticus]